MSLSKLWFTPVKVGPDRASEAARPRLPRIPRGGARQIQRVSLPFFLLTVRVLKALTDPDDDRFDPAAFDRSERTPVETPECRFRFGDLLRVGAGTEHGHRLGGLSVQFLPLREERLLRLDQCGSFLSLDAIGLPPRVKLPPIAMPTIPTTFSQVSQAR